MPTEEGFVGQDFVYNNVGVDKPWTTIQTVRHLSNAVLTEYRVTIDVPNILTEGLISFQFQLLAATQTGTGVPMSTGTASIDHIAIVARGAGDKLVVTRPDPLRDFTITSAGTLAVLELPQDWVYAQWDDTDGVTTYRWQLGAGGVPQQGGGQAGTFYNPGRSVDLGAVTGTGLTGNQSSMSSLFVRADDINGFQSGMRQMFVTGTGMALIGHQSSMQQQFRTQGPA